MNDSMHLVCPHCHAINRMPAAKLGNQPNCGQCHQPLFTGHPVELTTASFSKHVTNNDIPILVDFWAPWCGPCKMMAPVFAQAATMLEPEVRLAKVNTDTEQRLAAQFAIRSIPTLVIFSQGKEIARQAGAMGVRDIVQWVRNVI